MNDIANKPKINIGLDIGTTSVGYSIIDENDNIISLGVRLFDDIAANDNNNQNRREHRSVRRIIRRLKVRKETFKKLVVKYGYYNNIDEIENFLKNIDITKFGVQNPVELRVKALENVIPQDQLIFLLFYFLHNRGAFFEDDEITSENTENAKQKTEKNNKKIENIILSDGQYVANYLYEFYKKNHYYKDCGKRIFNTQIVEEVDQILKINNYLNPDFIEKYKELLTTIRDYKLGPGSENSPTKYGMWIAKGKKRDGDNLWDALIGKCTYCPTEKRGAKNAPISEVFNLFDNLTNIYINNSSTKLSKNIKEKILKVYSDYILNNAKSKKISEKLFQEENSDDNEVIAVGNFDDNNPVYKLNNFLQILKFIKKYDLLLSKDTIFSIDNINLANDIFKLLQEKNKNIRYDNIDKFLKQKYNKSLDDDGKKILDNVNNLFATHSLSYKAMEEYIKFWLDNLDKNDNQMVYFHNNNKNIENDNIYTKKYINPKIFDEEIISPTAKRSLTQTLKIVNKIIKKYHNQYDIENITIEMPRDKNSEDEKRNIKKMQDENKKLAKEFNEKLKQELNYEYVPSNTQLLKYKLWVEQEGIDIYDIKKDGTFGKIDFKELINKNNDLEIDHIIPISISCDNSFDNKILTRKISNKDKLNKTPYQYFSSRGEFEIFKNKVNEIYNKSKKKSNKKLKNLLYMDDPLANPTDFIGRNLSDTRYASKLVLNTLQDFFKNNPNFPNLKCKVIRGQLTNFARYNIFISNKKPLLPKNRDLYCHHAIDAAIVCYLGSNYKTKRIIDKCNDKIKWYQSTDEFILEKDSNNKIIIIDKKTGEVTSLDTDNILKIDEKTLNFGKQLAKYNTEYNEKENELILGEYAKKVKYSRMLINNKMNIALCNETIYGLKLKIDESTGKEEFCKIEKLNLINDKNINDYFINSDKQTKLLIYNDNKPLFEQLKQIVTSPIYNEDKSQSPFYNYMRKEYPEIEYPKSVIININNNKFNVKNIKYHNNINNIDNRILLQSHNKKAFLESLNWLSIRLYKNKNGKYTLLPINAMVLNYNNNNSDGKLKIDENKLNSILEKKNIDINTKPMMELFKGSILMKKDTNDLYYLCGCTVEKNTIELKPLYASTIYSSQEYLDENKKNNHNPRIRFTINKIIKEYYFAEVDELGNIYNKKYLDK